MTSRTRRARRLHKWRRYQGRADKLVRTQQLTCALKHPMRVNQGFFRAEGWDTRGVHRASLGHGD